MSQEGMHEDIPLFFDTVTLKFVISLQISCAFDTLENPITKTRTQHTINCIMIGLKTLAITCILGTTRAFAPNAVAGRPALTIHAEGLTRKSVLENVAVVGAALLLNGSPALASGGATAGGAYLLSAKQRYNDRVQSCLKAYIGLQKSLAGGSVDDVAAYFSTEDVGGWKDGSAAGYLLSNAFRRNSSAPPDSLPSVKVRPNLGSYCCYYLRPTHYNRTCTLFSHLGSIFFAGMESLR